MTKKKASSAESTPHGNPISAPVPSPKPKATLQDIADKCGMSVSTVSRILNGHANQHRISKETEAVVRKLAAEHDFVPNHFARSLRLQKTLTIGLVIPDVSNPFFAAIARQVTIGTHKHGYTVLLCDSQDSLEMEIESLMLLQSRNVEGVVVAPVGKTGEHLKEFIHGKLPMVFVDRFFQDIPLPYVASDNLAGAREATEHLIAKGHRRIACLQGLTGTSPNELRVRGYKEALSKHHLKVDERIIVGDSFSEQSGYIETKLLLKREPDMTAILALSNLNALGAVRALVEEKRRIPEDISIVSFDDPAYAAYLATPMTSVAQSSAEIGEVAVKLLFDQIMAPARRATGGILLPTTLITRDSVKRISKS